MRSKAGRIVCLAALLACFSIGARAQEVETRSEFWPEIDVFVTVKPKIRLFFLGTITKAQETRENSEGQVGAHVDFLLNKHLTLRTGYRYGFSLSGSDPFKEHRIVLEQTLRQPIPLGILLSDRNREDLRFVNGQFSARYRNRVTLEREFALGKRKLTPYASGEIYYDSRFDTWNRNRLAIGLQVPLKRGFPLLSLLEPRRQLVLDIYYMRQNDSRSQPHHVNGVGLAVSLYF